MNHHFSALRITELAASTDPQCDAAITNPPEGTAPTPNTSSTPAKASSDEIRSMARMANRMQREEINKAQRMLRDWYGVSHTPQLTQEGQQKIQALTQAPAGNPFDRAFLENFSNQRYRALMSSLNCQVKSDLNHDKLKHYCKGIVESKKRDINEMRDKLCDRFDVCDFQPSSGSSLVQSSNRYGVMANMQVG